MKRMQFDFSEFSWDNLRYLTIDQTLADISTFIDFVRQSLNTPNAPVILWGSQVGATLASWARLKYPHLVNGESLVYHINNGIKSNFYKLL